MLSPDGRLLAYNSNRSGRFQIHVTPLESTSSTQVSADGGLGGIFWRRDDKELFFVGADGKMIAVGVKAGVPSGPGTKPFFEATLDFQSRVTLDFQSRVIQLVKLGR